MKVKVTWKEPRAQATHDFWPVMGWNIPTSHGSHRSMLRCAWLGLVLGSGLGLGSGYCRVKRRAYDAGRGAGREAGGQLG